jgi:hypothetical protein
VPRRRPETHIQYAGERESVCVRERDGERERETERERERERERRRSRELPERAGEQAEFKSAFDRRPWGLSGSVSRPAAELRERRPNRVAIQLMFFLYTDCARGRVVKFAQRKLYHNNK